MSIGVSFIGIREKGKISVCEVNWLWGMDVFIPDRKGEEEGKHGKKNTRKRLREIHDTWHNDDKTMEKSIVKSEAEMLRKFYGDTYGIINPDGTYKCVKSKKVFLKKGGKRLNRKCQVK